MHIGAADAEGADPGAPRACPPGPGRELRLDIEGRAREIDVRIGGLEMKRRRQLPMLQGEHGLDQPGDA